jgi:hypothetical protein
MHLKRSILPHPIENNARSILPRVRGNMGHFAIFFSKHFIFYLERDEWILFILKIGPTHEQKHSFDNEKSLQNKTDYFKMTIVLKRSILPWFTLTAKSTINSH